MRVAFLIKLITFGYTETVSYETIDTFIELDEENESLETKIMKKYPTLNVKNCYDCIVFDQITKEKYLIVSNVI
jgi:hypothetical protein